MNFAGCSVRRLVSYVRQGPPRPAWSRGGVCLSCGFGDGSRSRRQASANSMINFLGQGFGETLGFDGTGRAHRQAGLVGLAAYREKDGGAHVATLGFASPGRLSVDQGPEEGPRLNLVDKQSLRIAPREIPGAVVAGP
jgi:hypothetical protein